MFASDPTYVRLGPMFTPISTAMAMIGLWLAARGRRSIAAGRLFMTLDAMTDTAAIRSNESRLTGWWKSGNSKTFRPLLDNTAMTTLRDSTNIRNEMLNAFQVTLNSSDIPDFLDLMRLSMRMTHPDIATQKGGMSTMPVTINPMRVNATTAIANIGGWAVARGFSCGRFERFLLEFNDLWKMMNSTRNSAARAAIHGSHESRMNDMNEILPYVMRRRLVRFEMGSSMDAVFARCPVAYAKGR